MIPDVYLASSSPRRKELLAQLGVRFAVVHPHVDESFLADETAEYYVARLALDKARRGLQIAREAPSSIDKPVIGADTCIVVGDVLVGKPKNRQHYLQLMAQLSGNRHKVYSAVAIAGRPISPCHPSPNSRADGVGEKCLVSSTTVRFREISIQEREWYWLSGEPKDKAGGYAIQGLAAAFVESIEGSYSAVVGLPLFETAQLLAEFGINPLHGIA